MTDVMIHPTADVQSSSIGAGTRIWQFVVVLPQASIGRDVNICSHCLIENDVVIGDRVTVKSGVQLWDGIELADDVFVGPNVTFTNDRFPRSKQYPQKFARTRVERGASIGAGAVILPGITIGADAMIGAGAVVTRSVPPASVVMGPAATVRSQLEPAKSEVRGSAVSIDHATVHQFKVMRDARGALSVGEFVREIPFETRRYFLVYDVQPNGKRGEHAHHKCHQFLICIKGSCMVSLDDGKRKKEIVLDAPNKGVYVPPMIWGEQSQHSEDAVLLVFNSDYYDPDDYIRDYAQFRQLATPAC